MSDEQLLNPEIREVQIGTRALRTITIYPLSLADQLATTAIFVEAIQLLFGEKEGDNFAFANVVRQTIEKNLPKIISFVTDEGDQVLSAITNSQAIEIAEIIFDVNYGSLLEKKVPELIEKIRNKFRLPKSRQLSSEDTLNTDLNISTTDDIEKEE